MNTDEVEALGWSDWRRWQYAKNRGSAVVHYANLTRGVACAPKTASLCRIQSTQLEASAYDRVLLSIPDELIALAALGQFIVVHDFSEKQRETRAMWQGLTLARVMMELRWYGELRSRYTVSRGGKAALQHIKNIASRQDEHVRRKFDYFRELTHVNDTTFVGLVSCRAATKGARCDFSGPNLPANSADQVPSNLW